MQKHCVLYLILSQTTDMVYWDVWSVSTCFFCLGSFFETLYYKMFPRNDFSSISYFMFAWYKNSPFSFKQLFLTILWLILHQLTFINAIKHQTAVLETMI